MKKKTYQVHLSPEDMMEVQADSFFVEDGVVHLVNLGSASDARGVGAFLLANIQGVVEVEPKLEVTLMPSFGKHCMASTPSGVGRVVCDGGSRAHSLKTWPEYFRAITDGTKRFELRENDRDFHVGDLLDLKEWDPGTGTHTGRSRRMMVTYLLQGVFGLPEGMCIMSIEPFGGEAQDDK